MDDRELTFMIKGQSSDYQDLAVQCAVVWRVADAARLGERVDFTIDWRSGAPLAKPEDQIRSVLTGLVLQFADTYLKQTGVQALLIAGLAPLQAVLHAAFRADPTLTGMGLEIVSIRVSAPTPSSELSRSCNRRPLRACNKRLTKRS